VIPGAVSSVNLPLCFLLDAWAAWAVNWAAWAVNWAAWAVNWAAWAVNWAAWAAAGLAGFFLWGGCRSCVLNFNNITGPAVIVLPLLFQQAGWVLPCLGPAAHGRVQQLRGHHAHGEHAAHPRQSAPAAPIRVLHAGAALLREALVLCCPGKRYCTL